MNLFEKMTKALERKQRPQTNWQPDALPKSKIRIGSIRELLKSMGRPKSAAEIAFDLDPDNGRREVWVPLSQVEEVIEEPTPPMGIVATTAIVVQDWVATEKGLQSSQQDDVTMDLFGGEG